MELDWDKYIICQQKTVELLKCPLQGSGTNENVEQFQAIGALPTNIYFEMKVLLVLQHTVHLGIKVAI